MNGPKIRRNNVCRCLESTSLISLMRRQLVASCMAGALCFSVALIDQANGQSVPSGITFSGAVSPAPVSPTWTPGANVSVGTGGNNGQLFIGATGFLNYSSASGNTVAIGDGTTGQLTVGAGGKLRGSTLQIGSGAGGSGEAVIDAGNLEFQGLRLGTLASSAEGKLTVTNGAVVDQFQIGGLFADVFVGHQGRGEVIVEGSSIVNTYRAFLGVTAGAHGYVRIENATWNSYKASSSVNAQFGIGIVAGATGELHVGPGGVLNTGDLVVQGGLSTPSTVSGQGAQVNLGALVAANVRSRLRVGGTNPGRLEISDDGVITAGGTELGGNNTGGTQRGELLVTGAGSAVRTFINPGLSNATGDAVIGLNGIALMWLRDHGLHDVAASMIIGNLAPSNGFLSIGGAAPGSLGGELRVAGNLTLGLIAGSVGSIVIGNEAGQAATDSGLMTIGGEIRFGAGAGHIVLNHTNSNFVIPNIVTSTGAGTHTIDQLAGTTRFTGQSGGFTGTTTVSGGHLILGSPGAPAALGGTVVVSGTGILSGTGTAGSVGGVDIQAGGTIAPGHSIGTLNVVGPYVQAAGSVYQVELDPNSNASDRIVVNGTAAIDAGAQLAVSRGLPGMYSPDRVYTVLTTTGGRTGTYTVTGDVAVSAFLSLVGDYDANNVYLRVVRSGDPSDVAQTPNEKQTAIGSGNTPAELLVLNAPDAVSARNVLNQLSGVAHASMRGSLIEGSRYTRDMAIERMRDAFCPFGGSSRAEQPVLDPQQGGCIAELDRFTMWGSVIGGEGRNGGDYNAVGYRRSTAGFVSGIDAPVGDGWRAGFLGGYSHDRFSASSSFGSSTSNNYHFGAYAGTQLGAWGVRLGATHAWHDISSSRTVALQSFVESNYADYQARTWQAFGELGYQMRYGTLALEPFANLAYVGLSGGNFTERGGITALTSHGGSGDQLYSTLGLRTAASLSAAYRTTARGKLGWIHAWSDLAPQSVMSFGGAQTFNILGAPIARDSVLVEAGLDMELAKATILSVTYGGRFGGHTSDQFGRGQLRVAF